MGWRVLAIALVAPLLLAAAVALPCQVVVQAVQAMTRSGHALTS